MKNLNEKIAPAPLLPLLSKAKSAYVLWFEYYQTIPRIHKYSFGQKTDNFFVETIEAIAIAGFLSKEEKLPWVKLAIRKVNTITVFLLILWEVGSLNDKKYIAISIKIDEIGKMLGGWLGQLKNKTPL